MPDRADLPVRITLAILKQNDKHSLLDSIPLIISILAYLPTDCSSGKRFQPCSSGSRRIRKMASADYELSLADGIGGVAEDLDLF
jgi:hypothetical protein